MSLYDKNRLLNVCQVSLNPSTVFESREVVIDRIVRICVEEVI
jgi:hypothetical protein